jgi:acylphosphatase
MTVRVRAVVSGRVQGVFYRDTCRETASRLGITGWVRNLPDGRVEIEAEGSRDAVDRLLAWARQGPPRGRVDGMHIVDLEPAATPGRFEVR